MFCDDPFLFLFAGDSIKQDSFLPKRQNQEQTRC